VEKTLTLASLAGGVAEELWQNELDRVLNNIDDPNTDHKPSRSIILKFTFNPDEERRIAAVEITAESKLANVRGKGTFVFLGRSQGVMTAIEQLTQEELFPVMPAHMEVVGVDLAGDEPDRSVTNEVTP
jgi:hypothetical protein